jgi:hypothetical protein
MESAQTAQVGRSHPRGSGLGAMVDSTSAIAGIVASFAIWTLALSIHQFV